MPAARRRSSATSTTTATCSSRSIPTARERSTSTGSTRATSAPASGATNNSPRSARSPWTTGQAGADRRQRRLTQPGARRRQDAGEHRSGSGQVVGGHHQRVHGALGDRVDGARDRERPPQGSDHHFVQDVASARSDRGVPRARAPDRSAAAPGPDRGRHGHQGAGVVGGGDGRAAQRRHRRHHSRVAHAEAQRRPARGSVRRVRAAPGVGPAIVFAERHRVPRLRPDDEHARFRNSPSASRTTCAT